MRKSSEMRKRNLCEKGERKMRTKDKGRVGRYRKAYPLDNHTDAEILAELRQIRNEKKYIDRWIERQANIELTYCFNGHK